MFLTASSLFRHQVSCMQFVNIVVHSVEDMNFRVHLQYEFTQIGLDDYLEVRKNNYCLGGFKAVEFST